MIVLVTSWGCGADPVGKVKEQSRKEKEQRAIKAYSAKVPDVDAKLRAFVKTWEKVNQQPDVKAHQEAWREALLPALKSYIDGLGAMPLATAELKRVHNIVLKSYKVALPAFETYPEGLNEKNRAERAQKILSALTAVTKADGDYRSELQQYYRANGVKLKTKK